MFTVSALPAFNDNYIWLLTHPSRPKKACVVDPGDADVVMKALQAQGLELESILITHHHADHTGGVKQLLAQTQAQVFGPAQSPFQAITRPLNDGDEISVLGLSLSILSVPGHTLDHIAYLHREKTPQLFCGDTLFLAGCGRLFEGTPAQMLNAMQRFKALPANTQVYCTHEYSLANLAFAEAVEPKNIAIQQVIADCKALREKNLPTLPSSIAQELRINPFLRTDSPAVVDAMRQRTNEQLSDETDIFAALREWKNNF